MAVLRGMPQYSIRLKEVRVKSRRYLFIARGPCYVVGIYPIPRP